jgi:hypothetical protein
MGRQIHFYLTPEDRNAFFRYIQERDHVVIVPRDSHSREIEPLSTSNIKPSRTVCLWNRKFLHHLERQWIPDPGYYRIDGLKTAILEFTPSFTGTWEGKPALGQGRLFGNFEPYLEKPKAFEQWFDSLVRWIRRNYQKNPSDLGGYIGPGAYEFYQSGGYLLPNFLPPRTKEWLAILNKQHPRSRKSSRTSKGGE